MARDTPGRADFQKMLAAIEKVRGRPSSLEVLESSTAARVDWLSRCTSISAPAPRRDASCRAPISATSM
ncbi:MAG: hypothetical protein AAFY88_09855, partial [Acidobacteriota bacterium]